MYVELRLKRELLANDIAAAHADLKTAVAELAKTAGSITMPSVAGTSSATAVSGDMEQAVENIKSQGAKSHAAKKKNIDQAKADAVDLEAATVALVSAMAPKDNPFSAIFKIADLRDKVDELAKRTLSDNEFKKLMFDLRYKDLVHLVPSSNPSDVDERDHKRGIQGENEHFVSVRPTPEGEKWLQEQKLAAEQLAANEAYNAEQLARQRDSQAKSAKAQVAKNAEEVAEASAAPEASETPKFARSGVEMTAKEQAAMLALSKQEQREKEKAQRDKEKAAAEADAKMAKDQADRRNFAAKEWAKDVAEKEAASAFAAAQEQKRLDEWLKNAAKRPKEEAKLIAESRKIGEEGNAAVLEIARRRNAAESKKKDEEKARNDAELKAGEEKIAGVEKDAKAEVAALEKRMDESAKLAKMALKDQNRGDDEKQAAQQKQLEEDGKKKDLAQKQAQQANDNLKKLNDQAVNDRAAQAMAAQAKAQQAVGAASKTAQTAAPGAAKTLAQQILAAAQAKNAASAQAAQQALQDQAAMQATNVAQATKAYQAAQAAVGKARQAQAAAGNTPASYANSVQAHAQAQQAALALQKARAAAQAAQSQAQQHAANINQMQQAQAQQAAQFAAVQAQKAQQAAAKAAKPGKATPPGGIPPPSFAAAGGAVPPFINASKNAFMALGSAAGQVISGIKTGFTAAIGVVGEFASTVSSAANGIANSNFARVIGASMVGMAGYTFVAEDSLERLRISLDGLLGSSEKGGKMFKELQDFAANTPFSFKQIGGLSQFMLSAGFEAKDLIGYMERLGDVVSMRGIGDPAATMQNITNMMQKMKAGAVITSREMTQLATAGIPGWEALAKRLGVSRDSAIHMVNKGQVGADVGLNALLDLGDDPRFKGGMKKIMVTPMISLAKMKDTAGQWLAEAGKPLVAAITSTINSVNDYLKSSAGKEMAATFSRIFTSVIDAVKPFAKAIVPLIPYIMGFLGALGTLAIVVPVLSTVLGSLASVIAILAIPITTVWSLLSLVNVKLIAGTALWVAWSAVVLVANAAAVIFLSTVAVSNAVIFAWNVAMASATVQTAIATAALWLQTTALAIWQSVAIAATLRAWAMQVVIALWRAELFLLAAATSAATAVTTAWNAVVSVATAAMALYRNGTVMATVATWALAAAMAAKNAVFDAAILVGYAAKLAALAVASAAVTAWTWTLNAAVTVKNAIMIAGSAIHAAYAATIAVLTSQTAIATAATWAWGVVTAVGKAIALGFTAALAFLKSGMVVFTVASWLASVAVAAYNAVASAGTVLTAVMTGALLLAKGAVWLLSAAWVALTSVMSVSTIIGVVVAAGALATAFFFVGSAVAGVYGAAMALFGILPSIFGALSGIDAGPLNAVTGVFGEWFDILKKIFETAKTDMPAAWDMLTSAAGLAVSQVQDLFPPLWTFLKDGFEAVARYMGAIFRAEASLFGDNLKVSVRRATSWRQSTLDELDEEEDKNEKRAEDRRKSAANRFRNEDMVDATYNFDSGYEESDRTKKLREKLAIASQGSMDSHIDEYNRQKGGARGRSERPNPGDEVRTKFTFTGFEDMAKRVQEAITGESAIDFQRRAAEAAERTADNTDRGAKESAATAKGVKDLVPGGFA